MTRTSKSEKNSVTIIEDASIKIKLLFSSLVESPKPLSLLKLIILDIIKIATESLEDVGLDKDFIQKAKRSLMGEYIALRSIYLTTSKLTKDVKSLLAGEINITHGYPNAVQLFSVDNDGILSLNQEELRKYVSTNEYGNGQMLIEDYRSKMKSAMEKTMTIRPTLTDKKGRVMSLRNLAEMQVRYEAQEGALEKFKGNIVLASQHQDASIRCEIWQGKLFQVDTEANGKPGKPIKGYVPKPLGKVDGKDYYSLSDALAHGFLGYNCRHRLMAYHKNMEIPKPIPSNIVNREREIETNMRAMEREIRMFKERQVLDKENRGLWIEASKRAQSEYVEYASKNNYAIETWRTRVTLTERQLMGIR